MSVAAEYPDRSVAGVADDQIGHTVAVQVGREDLRGLGPVASEATLTNPVERRAKNEIALSLASTLAITRPRLVETKAMPRDGSPGLTVTGGAKLPGSPGLPAR